MRRLHRTWERRRLAGEFLKVPFQPALINFCPTNSPARRRRSQVQSRLVIRANFSFLQRMPSWIVVVLLGIIEGITEFLPVSSTGHLLIAEKWLPRQSDLFNVVIQCGAVLAVLPVFPERLSQFLHRWREKDTQ